jgi:hypothetical protein
MPYVQAWKGSYRFRAEANRRVVPHIERTNEDIRDAEQGNWPRVDDERLADIALEWWQWHLKARATRLKVPVGLPVNSIDGHRIALTGGGQLGDSLIRSIAERESEVHPHSSAFARLKHECEILHHGRTDGYYSEIDDRREATVKILDAVGKLEVEPQQVAAFIADRQYATKARNSDDRRPERWWKGICPPTPDETNSIRRTV